MIQEIERAKQEHRATSRHHLAEALARRTDLSYRDALVEVEAYCETKEPAIPQYLSWEFGIFWLKVVAVANAAVGVVLLWQGVGLFRAERPAWPMWALGTIFVGIGAFVWVRSLEAEGDRSDLEGLGD